MRAGAENQQAAVKVARSERAAVYEYVRRFTLFQVLEHAVLMISFTGLALTGIPQKYAQLAISRWFIGLLGGIERVRVVHHWLAFILLGLGAVHLLELLVRAARYGLRTEMWPHAGDLRDLLHQLRYFVGLEAEPPKYGRYSFKEKFEYWAVVWGTVVMGLTGLILLYPEVATRYLPGVAVPAARAAHGGEAVLAVVAILIWHMYNAHLRADVFPLDPVIFTGLISKERMEEEHPLELQRLHASHAASARESHLSLNGRAAGEPGEGSAEGARSTTLPGRGGGPSIP